MDSVETAPFIPQGSNLDGEERQRDGMKDREGGRRSGGEGAFHSRQIRWFLSPCLEIRRFEF